MFQNYLKSAIRNLAKHKLFTALNILGLTTGMTCSIFILLWVQDEVSYDKFNRNANKLYRVTARISGVDVAIVPPPLPAAIKTEIPSIKNATRLVPLQKMITVGAKKFDERNIYYTDANFLQMFSYPLISGDIAKVLTAPDAVVITEATAIKYFGETADAVGKTIYIDDDIKGRNLVVTGVLKNIPANSHLHFDMLLPIEAYDRRGNAGVWDNYNAYVYFQLTDGINPTPSVLKAIETQINAITKRNDPKTESIFSVQHLTDIHLHSHFMADVEGQGSGRYVTVFSLIAAFVLLIACINFTNLSTALSSKRAKEVGLRKTIGAQRYQLIIQFIGQSVLLSFVSLILAFALVVSLLPLFNELAAKSISVSIFSLKTGVALLFLCFLVGVLSGSYPALFLSSFTPVKILKGVKLANGNSFFRSGLVVLQFAISIVLIISTLVVYQQLQFIKNRDIGFNKENLLYVKMPEAGDLRNNYEAMKSMLREHHSVSGFTIIDRLPTNLTNAGSLAWPGMDANSEVLAVRLRTDENFIKTLGIRLLKGRFFSRDYQADDSSYVVNETALRVMNMPVSDALGKRIKMGEREGTIIGVVRDFNFKPVHQPVEPLVMKNNRSGGYVILRTTPANIRNIIEDIKRVYGKIYSDYPFSYGFINEDLSKLYVAEQQMGRLFNIFSILSIIISCLGLFGLAAFTTQTRSQEIGIRKVLGASVANITVHLSRDFIRLVLIAVLIGSPLAWYFMNKWLENFAYRIEIPWWIFALSGSLGVIIALATVGFQAIKAAVANPVKSLRTE